MWKLEMWSIEGVSDHTRGGRRGNAFGSAKVLEADVDTYMC